MTEDLPEGMEDDDVKKAFKDAMLGMHPEDAPEKDPFETDALGRAPAEEDDSGGE